MSFIKRIFSKKEEPITTYEDFWTWFRKNEKSFFHVVEKQGNIEREFFNKLSPKLKELKDGFFYLTGMYDDNTAELILTADGYIKNIVFVEELVSAAPKFDRWKITALKPPSDIKEFCIEMGGYKFGTENLKFYATQYADYPDEINITIVHHDYDEENKSTIINGTYIFIDNYLGELNSVTTIDSLKVIGPADVTEELVPMEKLKAFLVWRQKEFMEKYDGVRHETDEDAYSVMEAELENGNWLIAVINTDLLKWDRKASHPWIVTVEIKFDGSKSKGMPDNETFQLLEQIESRIARELKDSDGYLNIGRQTAEGCREIYFACKEFRRPSKILHQVCEEYSGNAELSFEICIDKYWRSFNRFNTNA